MVQTELFHERITSIKAIKSLSNKKLLTKEIFWSIICLKEVVQSDNRLN